MKNKRAAGTTFAVLLTAALVCGSAYAQVRERFMPATEVAKISMNQRQDGLALHLTIKNDSAMVITSGEFICNFRDRAKPRPAQTSNGKQWCTSENFFVSSEGKVIVLSPCVHDEPFTLYFNEQIRPGKSKEHYYEMSRDWPQIYQCTASQLRAREAKFWER